MDPTALHPRADLSQRLGRPYYPKLQACVPFTPCPGARLMVRGDLPAETRREAIRAMVGRKCQMSLEATLVVNSNKVHSYCRAPAHVSWCDSVDHGGRRDSPGQQNTEGR